MRRRVSISNFADHVRLTMSPARAGTTLPRPKRVLQVSMATISGLALDRSLGCSAHARLSSSLPFRVARNKALALGRVPIRLNGQQGRCLRVTSSTSSGHPIGDIPRPLQANVFEQNIWRSNPRERGLERPRNQLDHVQEFGAALAGAGRRTQADRSGGVVSVNEVEIRGGVGAAIGQAA